MSLKNRTYQLPPTVLSMAEGVFDAHRLHGKERSIGVTAAMIAFATLLTEKQRDELIREAESRTRQERAIELSEAQVRDAARRAGGRVQPPPHPQRRGEGGAVDDEAA